MPATVTFKVTSINDAGSQVQVTFQIATQVGGQAQGGSQMSLAFPTAEGREFEVGDTYQLQIAPQPESGH